MTRKRRRCHGDAFRPFLPIYWIFTVKTGTNSAEFLLNSAEFLLNSAELLPGIRLFSALNPESGHSHDAQARHVFSGQFDPFKGGFNVFSSKIYSVFLRKTE